MNSCVSNRALREIYLKPFEIVIEEANPYSVMSSYNMVNGKHVASSKDLISDVLRNDFGFEGAVFSDWWPHMSHISMIQSGNTYKSASPEYDSLIAAYHSGVLSRIEFEKIAKVSIEFLMKTTAGTQKNTKVKMNDSTILKEENRTFEGKTDQGYSRIWRITVETIDQFILSFDNLDRDVKLFINNEVVNVDKDNISILLNEGVNEIRIDGSSKEKINDAIIYIDIEHAFSEWTIVEEPTCTTDGEEVRTCEHDSSHIETRTIPATNHEYTDYVSNNDATCQEDGTKQATCNHGCGTIDVQVDENSKVDHVWDEGVVTKEPTDIKDGEVTYTCMCGETKVVTISKTGNNVIIYVVVISLIVILGLGSFIFIKKKNK